MRLTPAVAPRRARRRRSPSASGSSTCSASRRWYDAALVPARYQAIVLGARARTTDLDPALLAAVIYQESKFHADAESRSRRDRADAAPAGHRRRGSRVRTGGTQFRVADLYDPEINVRYGSWYLRHLLDKYGDERLALAAYNAGQKNVDRWRREGRGIHFPETRALREARRGPEGDLPASLWPSDLQRDTIMTFDRCQSDVIMMSPCRYTPHVEALQADLAAIAAVGRRRRRGGRRAAEPARLRASRGPPPARRARRRRRSRCASRCRPATSSCASPARSPSLVYVEDASPEPAPARTADGAPAARITLRLARVAQGGVEAAAAREGAVRQRLASSARSTAPSRRRRPCSEAA